MSKTYYLIEKRTSPIYLSFCDGGISMQIHDHATKFHDYDSAINVLNFIDKFFNATIGENAFKVTEHLEVE